MRLMSKKGKVNGKARRGEAKKKLTRRGTNASHRWCGPDFEAWSETKRIGLPESTPGSGRVEESGLAGGRAALARRNHKGKREASENDSLHMVRRGLPKTVLRVVTMHSLISE